MCCKMPEWVAQNAASLTKTFALYIYSKIRVQASSQVGLKLKRI